jgi:hypothetical protein
LGVVGRGFTWIALTSASPPAQHNVRPFARLQVVINCGALQCLLSLLTASHKKSIKKEACWTISNITAGTKEQIQSVIDAQLISPLVHLLGVSSAA